MVSRSGYDIHPHALLLMQWRRISESEIAFLMSHEGVEVRSGPVRSQALEDGRRLVLMLSDESGYRMVIDAYWELP